MHNDRPSIATTADLKPKNTRHAVASYCSPTYVSAIIYAHCCTQSENSAHAFQNTTSETVQRRCASVYTNPQKYDNFFRYTKGQWSQDGGGKLSKRHQEFNVEALKRIAIESVGAKSCSTMTKMSESGYNRVFKLTMDNGAVAIARIPLRNLCPDSKATASEVATMDFARTILDIPVSKVYAWSADSNNPVKTDYIIMEKAPGISRANRNYESYKSVVSRNELVAELASRQNHGSIYYVQDWFTGCEKAEVVNDIPIELKKEVEERFAIGKTAHEFLKSQANNQIKWLSQKGLQKSSNRRSFFDSQLSPSAHIDLYNRFLDIHRFIIPENSMMARSSLWHTNINSNHVFVKDGHITILIDWQFAWTGPLFLQFDSPAFTQYNRAMRLEEFSEASPLAHDGSRIRRISFDFFKKDLYRLEIFKQVPLLEKMKDVPTADIRSEIIGHGFDTWNGNIVELRERLIKFERNWEKMEFNIPCPIHFTKEEVQTHIQEVMIWDHVEELWRETKIFIDENGYISKKDYRKGIETWILYPLSVCRCGSYDFGEGAYTSKEKGEARERRTKWILKNGWEVLRKRALWYGSGTTPKSRNSIEI
ncbi:hypothetical protein ACHAO8_002739 [Botrytis cinerea]